MAQFKIAFDITNGNEGFYANDIHDKGGETYRGISRKNWPNWNGWAFIDSIKAAGPHFTVGQINNAIKLNPSIEASVEKFFEKYFWDVLLLDQIMDQQIANGVYDFGVNSGTGTSAKMLQRAAAVKADGFIGPHTIQAVNAANPKEIYDIFCGLRRGFYLQIIERDPSQKEFEHSWMSRIKPYIT